MPEIFTYGFMSRALIAGSIVAIIAPLIGIFLVLRRYSLIADTFSHISLASIAAALFFGWNPVLTTLILGAGASLGIEKLNRVRKIYSEAVLAIFLSGALAIASIFIGFGKGGNITNWLFGSILTVSMSDIWTMLIIGVIVVAVVKLFYKELLFISFDENSAQVSGLPVKFINRLLILLIALVISLAIPIVGILLISALITLPVITALQFRVSFIKTIVIAEIVSVFSVLSGIITSFYLDSSTGGTIVLIMIAIFLVSLPIKNLTKKRI
ncbi:metal ABC transporter permease [Candidatus Saccharibacteria bacterium]|nr:metal ABC transporter permease [Candidatus Saccharibacteria bacterium]MCL1962706.1 metal ABC transporter permease [Candidatus Saccharibacteria bacterium]